MIYTHKHACAFRDGTTAAQKCDETYEKSDAHQNIGYSWSVQYDVTYSNEKFEEEKWVYLYKFEQKCDYRLIKYRWLTTHSRCFHLIYTET